MRVLVLLFLLVASPLYAQAVVVNHSDIPDFGSVPSQFITDASNLDMVFVNRSVGGNVTDGLTCMSSTYAAAASNCKRFNHPQGATYPHLNNATEDWTGTYSRTNWDFFGWIGTGILPEVTCTEGSGDVFHKYLNCITSFVAANTANYAVFSMIPSYLDGASGGCLTGSDATDYLAMMSTLRSTYPAEKFIYWTSSTARGSDNNCNTFNAAVRSEVDSTSGYLVDIADIESYTQEDHPTFPNIACFDNRDGVEYIGNTTENYPDDGIATQAICAQYTSETEGGHMGNPDIGKIRVAKGFWMMMAHIAGWEADEEPSGTGGVRLRFGQ